MGLGATPLEFLVKQGNRHGMIAGATGTGKTVTMQVLAEGFSNRGVPVFMADVKGDVAGMSQPGGGKPKLEDRAKQIGLEPYTYAAFPTVFWDLFGEKGHPIRATISEMGPLLLSRLLDLNDVQEGVLTLTFRVADDNGLLLLDLKDLRLMLQYVADHASEITTLYGNVSATTVGAIQRSLLVLEDQGGDQFYGEPALDLSDLMRTHTDGRGIVNILAADRLMQSPRLYSTFLLWLLSELFENLPEVGDLDKPKFVFFFDEAHLLFNGAPRALLEKIEQVVRLIRSKGVGVYFISQNPMDIPESVLAQLGNRFQHALRAFTPKDQKDVRATAENFRVNPSFDTATAILELGIGEALVSVLDEKGTPGIVDRVLIRPPASRLGAATPEERSAVIQSSPVGAKYQQTIDRESAFELLRAKAQQAATAAEAEARAAEQAKQQAEMNKRWEAEQMQAQKEAEKRARETYRETRPSGGGGRRSDTIVEATIKSVARSAGSSLGRQLIRGILGGLLRGRR